MNKIIITLLVLFPIIGYCQSETQSSEKVMAEFNDLYNAGDYSGIFDLFSPSAQAALPLKRTQKFLKKVKSNFGAIKSYEFNHYDKSYASYKTQFENGLMAINISLDRDAEINGYSIKPFKDMSLPSLKENKTEFILPFTGEWTVGWGGNTAELNHHHSVAAQKYAFDLVITDDSGKSYKTDGKSNEDYYVFGKELIAPCNAEVVLVVDGIKDNTPGEKNPIYVPGNTVILKTENNEYLVFAHFKQHSIEVKQGDRVTSGQVLGLCGNSGNSTEAHLHFHMQNVEEQIKATGGMCFFSEILVNGKLKSRYSPVKGDKVKNK